MLQFIFNYFTRFILPEVWNMFPVSDTDLLLQLQIVVMQKKYSPFVKNGMVKWTVLRFEWNSLIGIHTRTYIHFISFHLFNIPLITIATLSKSIILYTSMTIAVQSTLWLSTVCILHCIHHMYVGTIIWIHIRQYTIMYMLQQIPVPLKLP
jgi:hypothetical protein